MTNIICINSLSLKKRNKVFISVILILIFSEVSLFCKDIDKSESVSSINNENLEERSPHEVGIYFKDYFPVARMHNHSYNFVGGGLSYAYHSPWNIPVFEKAQNIFGSYLNIGLSGRIDAVGAIGNDEYIKNWYTFNVFGGAFLQWIINSWFEIQPSVEYGLQFDTVHSTRDADGLYVNQAFQLSPSFKFRPSSINKDGLSVEVAPIYTMSFEKGGIANYFGIRIGGMYRIGGKNFTSSETKIEYVEKEVIKEVVKEVPVEKIVEKEIIKEVPVEVIKYVEVPVEVEKETDNIENTENIIESEDESLEENSESLISETEIILAEKVELAENSDGSLYINIPNLNFASNTADLLDSYKNRETINQVFLILNDELYKEYKCIITGYVNPDKEEWSKEEQSLAIERAESVRNELIKLGVDETRFTVSCGSGKTDNNEYNRRVEFKLVK